MLDRPFLSRFSPQRTDPEALEQILVQRHDLLAESVERVRDSVLTDNKHHLLFIGPRGIGKTNLVSLIVHRLKKLPKLQSKMRLAWLNEDETATSFLKLLILIYRDLTQRYPDEFPAADLQRVYGHKPDHARELLGASLLEHLGKRTLVVIMENLDSLFKDMPVEEQRTWRAFVQNHPVFATVGTAQSLFDGVSERTEPFFGFFDTRHLDNLTVDEAITLLRNVAKLNRDDKLEAYLATPTGHARVQAIHDLAGGNPRIYMIFSSFLTVELLDDLVRPFEETADQQLTSYYQERLRWLSAQQREIVQYLCHQRFPVPVKQIAEGMFASHQTIANQLKILRDYRYVRGNERGREVLYELSEPLMRLALQVKETNDRKPLSLIVDFLRVWYDKEEIESRLIGMNSYSRGREYFEEALSLITSEGINLRHTLLRQSLSSRNSDEFDEGQLLSLQCLAEESGACSDWLKLAEVFWDRGESDRAINALTHVIDSPTADQTQLLEALNFRGVVYGHLDAMTKAIADFTRLIDTPDAPQPTVESALFNRAEIFRRVRRGEEAVEDYSRLISTPGASPNLVASALFLRALWHLDDKDVDAAINDYSALIETPNMAPLTLAKARLRRAELMEHKHQFKEVVFDCSEVLKLPGIDDDLIACTLNNRILALWHLRAFGGLIDDALRLIEFSKLSSFESNFNLRRGMLTTFVVSSVFAENVDPTNLVGRTTQILAAFAKNDLTSVLAEGLLEHLPTLAESAFNWTAYDSWFYAWSNAAESLKPEDRQHLEIPLRLLRTGIAYYKTKDEGVLLSLPSEERKILRQVLKLEPEPVV